MTVTEIKEISKSKVQITIDYEFAFVLYKGELRSYGLKEGLEVKEDVYREIVEEVLTKRAKLCAMHLLKSRAYTTKQLYDKLSQGGYPECCIQAALSYVTSYHYLDDVRYATDYIDYHRENKTKMQMVTALIKKGISKDIIDCIWEENAEFAESNIEQKQILLWMKKRNFNPSEADFEEKRKFSAFLYRKGFQIDSIRSALSLDITSI